MSLEILNNRADHTHENEQFRRIVDIIEHTFEKNGYKGVLIGNPYNDHFSRFRGDAILLYDNGLVIIDLKDYEGVIQLPEDEDDFERGKWYSENIKDKVRTEVKGGSYSNPFYQLKKYREEFYEVVRTIPHLQINASRVSIVNIFSGPITVENKVPKKFRYYRLLQESNLGEFLEDFVSENSYSENLGTVLKTIFPAEEWIKSQPLEIEAEPIKIIEIESDVENSIKEFLSEDNGGVLVLESMKSDDRDSWMRYLLREATSFNIPQVETWSHSSRISKKIFDRTNIQTQGVYSVIYGGSHSIEGGNDEKIGDKEAEESLMEIIPIRANEAVDEKALIIIHEAHLVNRSLNQSELLRFGTGRLLEDITTFLDPDSDRKTIFIGDPYSMTYGKDEDKALDLDTLSEFYSSSIKHYREPIDFEYTTSKERLTIELASSIENKLFNNLDYSYDNLSLHNVNVSQVQEKLKQWFSQPLLSEPKNGVLFYSKKDCLKTNKWIKKNILKNDNKLASGDLLIANNNVAIPDDTGLQNPKRIVNGMFFTVLEVKGKKTFPIALKNSSLPITLSFTNVYVRCLSLNSKPETDLWILDNYFLSEDNLSKEERIAFRIFCNKKVDEEKLKNKFEDSLEYKQLFNDSRYKELSSDEKQALDLIVKNYGKSKADKTQVNTTQVARKILGHYNKKYTKNIFTRLRETDPFINAVNVNYGWAITVHKALGSFYDEIIIKGHRKENDGITNDSYFRWLYSGVSCSINTLYIAHPQIVHPFMSCNFEDKSEVGVLNGEVKRRTLLTYPDFKEVTRFSEVLEPIENLNVKGAVCKLSISLEKRGYLLESIKKFTDYLTKVYYSIPESTEKQLVLNIDNKGKKNSWAVGNVRIESHLEENLEFVNASIDSLFTSNTSIETSSDISMLIDFRKDIYSKWLEDFKAENYTLQMIKSHNNQDIFFSKNKDGDAMKFKVWYGTSVKSNTKGFITKIEVIEKTNAYLTEELKQLIFTDF